MQRVKMASSRVLVAGAATNVAAATTSLPVGGETATSPSPGAPSTGVSEEAPPGSTVLTEDAPLLLAPAVSLDVPVSDARIDESQESLAEKKSVLADAAKMRRDWGVDIRGAQELGTGESLAKVAFAATGVKLSKKKKTCKSNWESRTLSPSQVVYAALDAWVAAEAYQSRPPLLQTPTAQEETPTADHGIEK
jgi:hypothetical protein